MGLKTVQKGCELTATIDKVLINKEKVANGVTVNGKNFYMTKSSGMSVTYTAGTPIKMVYDHAQDTESNNDVYFIKSLDLSDDEKDSQLDSVMDKHVKSTDYSRTPKELVEESEGEVSREDNINLQSARKDACVLAAALIAAGTVGKKKEVSPTDAFEFVEYLTPKMYALAFKKPAREDDVPF